MEAAPDDIRVLLIDDHEPYRRGLRELLEERGIDVIGEAGDGHEGVELAVDLDPDVVVMDINMPGLSGIEATRRLRHDAPRCKVLALTITADDDVVVGALLAGAIGCVLKDAPVNDIGSGVRAAANGESFISPRIGARLLQHIRGLNGSQAELERAELSARELEVLRLLAQGCDTDQIAAELVISPWTVKNHVASILVKLHVGSRLQAAVYAVRLGLG